MAAELIYWDSCVFIDLIQKHPERYDRLRKWYKRAEDGEIALVISTLTIAEVCKVNGRELSHDKQAKLIEKHLRQSWCRVYEVDRGIAEEAARLSRTMTPTIRPHDAIHIATALEAEVSAFHSYDERVLRHNGKIGVPVLRIEEPPTKATQADFSEVDFEK